MKVTIVGSTKPGHAATVNESLKFSGYPYFSFNFENIPLILAMILNNEGGVCTAFNQSGLHAQISGKEKELYEKWLRIFGNKIRELYPSMPAASVQKLAQDNAGYLISVFTPATTMGYTVSLQQINYILNWMENEIERPTEAKFFLKLKPVLQEFYGQIWPLVGIPGLQGDSEHKASLFSDRLRFNEFGENYCVSYRGTMAYLAQVQRYRDLSYEISLVGESMMDYYLDEPYVPECIDGSNWMMEWLEDFEALKWNYPQGMRVGINERGTMENLVAKCKEQLCGRTQLETAIVTRQTLQQYYCAVTDDSQKKFLQSYISGARCTFPDFICTQPCRWGAGDAFLRLV